MGFSTSVVFLLIFTTGMAIGAGLYTTQSEYSSEVQGATDEQATRMTEQIYTDIEILNYSIYVNRTYDFSTGAQVDKWAAEKTDELTNPPSTGPFISDERNFDIDDYNAISVFPPNNNRADTTIDVNRYAIHHFLFTIYEAPEAIFNLSIYWEGYAEQYPTYVYIWNYASGWELIGIGTSTSSDNVITKDFTVNNANIANYIDEYGYLHLVATSYASIARQELYTDFVRVFTEIGGLWVKNTGEITLEPDHAVLFDNSAYVASSQYATNMAGEYWEPGEILVIKYNPDPGSHLFKVTTENGVSDSYRYEP